VRRVVAQSIAFVYAPGTPPYDEAAPLYENAPDSTRVSVEGVLALERAVTGSLSVEGVVLRYGRLYGPGTWFERRPDPPALHPDAAAHAALLALSSGRPGIYNIAEEDGAVSIHRARAEFGFDPGFRLTASR
jgi:nucleoside-diphosphate-sugar epimerase